MPVWNYVGAKETENHMCICMQMCRMLLCVCVCLCVCVVLCLDSTYLHFIGCFTFNVILLFQWKQWKQWKQPFKV